MNALRSALTAGLLMLGAGSQLALADAAKDTEMLKLASTSGCLTCHHIEPGKLPDGRAPVGPAWRDVAAKYKDNKDAQNQLTQIVMQGSNPYSSHWKGKVTGLAMPPNAVAITEADASKLVGWILSLNTK
jgi:cytochrome c